MADAGHKCTTPACINWCQFDDEPKCFECTPPVSPSGCHCKGCSPWLYPTSRPVSEPRTVSVDDILDAVLPAPRPNLDDL